LQRNIARLQRNNSGGFMTATTASTTIPAGSATGLPPELRKAQEAMYLPEVQEMLKKLAAYNLGIFMPHMHGEGAGRFEPLAQDMVQVEAGLRVSFRPAESVGDSSRYFPVGWMWRGEGSTAAMACLMKCVVHPGDTMHYSEHPNEPL
jgi:hypothetical protein